MSQLHELIAVEPSLAARYRDTKSRAELLFNKREMLQRTVKSEQHLNAAEAVLDNVVTNDISARASDLIGGVLAEFSTLVDATFQKELTNQVAKADLIVDGKILAASVPGIMLLNLESKLADLREVIAQVPTLAAGPVWELDPTEKGLWKTASPVVTFKTKKMPKAVELSPATDKFPAQIEKFFEDVPSVKVETTVWSGMLTNVEKEALLDRLDSLAQATKQARMRANGTTVVNGSIAATLASYILGE